MNLQEYENLIVDTSEEDWTKISCWGGGSGPSFLNKFDVWTSASGEFKNLDIDSHSEYYSLKKNLLVSVACGITHNDNFREVWANKFADSYAISKFVDFFYSNILVYRDVYVAVDGGRAILPLPKIIYDKEKNEIKKLVVSKNRYNFFKILNVNSYEYDEYIRDAGFEIIDSEWMTGDGY